MWSAHKLRSSKTFVTFVVSTALFTDLYLSSTIVPILPYALSDIVGLPQEEVQIWNSILISSYGAALGVGSLFIGWMGDRLPNRQTPFILGLVFVGAATLAFALGQTIAVLFAARILQGLASAIVSTVGNALLFDVVGKEGIGQAMGYTSMSLTLGILLGPVVGGALYEYAGYYQVFIPVFVLIALEILLRLLVIAEKPIRIKTPSPRSPQTKAMDRTYGAAATEHTQVDDTTNMSPTAHPNGHAHLSTESDLLLPISSPNPTRSPFLILLSSPRMLVSLSAIFVLNGFTAGLDGVLPVYVADLLSFNAANTALLFLIITIPLLASPLAGILSDRVGPKYPAAVGFAIMILSLVGLRYVTYRAFSAVAILAVLLFFLGVGTTVALPPLMAEVPCAVEEIERKKPGVFGPNGAYSLAFGLRTSAFAGSAMVGPLYAGFVKEWLGWEALSLFMGLQGVVMMVLIVLVTGGYHFRREIEDAISGAREDDGDV